MRTTLQLILILFACNSSIGQTSPHIRSPRPNEEICLKDIVPISATYTNRDSVTRTLVARFTITNIVTKVKVYDTTDTLRNIPPGATIDTTFPDYITNPNLLTQLGSFLACTKISALDASGAPITDWPFADSSCVRIFGIRTTNLPFNDAINDYSVAITGEIPDQRKWVSLGATAVEGDEYTWDPPAPRTQLDDSGGFGPQQMKSPLLRLDRSDINGKLYAGSNVGDTLMSYPFNLKGQSKVIIAFDFMRSGKQQYPTFWDGKTMIGPEHAVINSAGQVTRPGDSLILEFKDPSQPKCNPAQWNRIAAIGGGHDVEFQSFWLTATATSATYRYTGHDPIAIALDRNYIDSAARFRLRLKASSNSESISTNDDDDPWYIDNISFQVPRRPEIEVTWVRVITPYTKIPQAGASGLPVYLKIKNLTVTASIGVPMKVSILNDKLDTVYAETINVTIGGGVDSVLRMPDWNAQSVSSTQKFTVHGRIGQTGYDSYTDDNETHSTFYLSVDRSNAAIQEFALDDAGMSPEPASGNDMPSLTGISGMGIGFQQSTGSYAMKFTLPQQDTLIGARLYFGSANTFDDKIQISVLQGDSASCIPGDTVEQFGTTMTFTDKRTAPFDRFSPYYFPKPIVLPAGVYWLSVSQLALRSFMMGGDLSRGGGAITVADDLHPSIAPVYSSPYGTQWSPTENSGDVSCAFAVEVPAGTGQWSPWMPSTGHWPVSAASGKQQAVSLNPKFSAPFINAGTYFPMIRPLVGSFGGQVHVAASGPIDVAFDQPYPNPFTLGNGHIELKFTLSRYSPVSLILYDAVGRPVRTLINSTLDKGPHAMRWDGTDENGGYVSPGLYLCRFVSDDRIVSARLLLLR